MIKRFVIALAGVVGISLFGVAGAAGAQPVTQEGLVNLNISDVGVQIPISLAANICDVNVAVLVDDLIDRAASCEASSDSTAVIELPTGSPGDPITQRGLINVNVSNVAVQVPIGIAANVCDVNVGILVSNFQDQADACDADAVAITEIA